MLTRSCSEAKGFGAVFASERSVDADTVQKDSVIVHAIGTPDMDVCLWGESPLQVPTYSKDAIPTFS